MQNSWVKNSFAKFWQPALLAAALLFSYAPALKLLLQTWWTDENYSHGLLIPFLIGFLLWFEKDELAKLEKRPAFLAGGAICLTALGLLLVGILGAELFTQRFSLALMLAGITIYFFGWLILKKLVVPFVLLLLAIPIPTILFNKIAFPLQLLATDLAVWGIRLFGIPAAKFGNVIELLPRGASQSVWLEVVEACSGIRSLMTLVTLALVYAYFTSRRRDFASFKSLDLWRAAILMLAALPIAVLTNGARLTATGILAYYYGSETAQGFLHGASGWMVYIAALLLLLLVGKILDSILKTKETEKSDFISSSSPFLLLSFSFKFWFLLLILLAGGSLIHWREAAGEIRPERKLLNNFPAKIGDWQQNGTDQRFEPEEEAVLGSDDYLMRDYFLPASGKGANLYIGYYETQRTGATYHSPRNCLPGSGWTMTESQPVEIVLPNGQKFVANNYVIENNRSKALMLYWYQGRGRYVANEYKDKFFTVLDSISRRRSDGAMVRIVVSIDKSEQDALEAAKNLAVAAAANLTEFVPN
ncbi:MAG: EpsI family protein [Acidobacteriota bacterium]|nr:EpsI family protein [Acidobacteriota bacterium]